MNFTLKPDDNGIVVVLKDVADEDISKLEDANVKSFDPTESPFDKYYAYDKRIGFHVSENHFDHAEHKGKRMSFPEYMHMISDGEIVIANDAIEAVDCIHQVVDATFDIDFIVERIKDINMPKDVNSAITALSNVNFALSKLNEVIDEADETQKQALHDAMKHAFDIYAKADEILFKSEFSRLLSLNAEAKSFLQASSAAQAKLLQKYHENF